MAVPKRKVSKARRDKRRSSVWKLDLPGMTKCPKCGEGEIIEKKSKSGKIFYGCNKYPDCDFALWDEPTGEKCPNCGELMIKKTTSNGTVERCSNRKCGYKKG